MTPKNKRKKEKLRNRCKFEIFMAGHMKRCSTLPMIGKIHIKMGELFSSQGADIRKSDEQHATAGAK